MTEADMMSETATTAYRIGEGCGFCDGERPSVVVGDVDTMDEILAKCSRAAKKAGLSPKDIKLFRRFATSGPYDHFIEAVYRYFDVSEG